VWGVGDVDTAPRRGVAEYLPPFEERERRRELVLPKLRYLQERDEDNKYLFRIGPRRKAGIFEKQKTSKGAHAKL